MEVIFSSTKCLIFLFLMSPIYVSGQAEEEEDSSFKEDAKKQLTFGIQEFKRIVETGITDNTKTGELASDLEKHAMEMRRKMYANQSQFPEDRSSKENATAKHEASEDVTLDRLYNLLSFKLFGARREYGLLSKMQLWTQKMLMLTGQKGVDPENNKYYEERKKMENKAVRLLLNYQSKLTSAKGILTRLRDLQATYVSVTGNDFSEFPEWMADARAAAAFLKKYQTDVFTRAYKEMEKTDYLIKNLQNVPRMGGKTCDGPSCQQTWSEYESSEMEPDPLFEATVREALDSDFDLYRSGAIDGRRLGFVKCSAEKITKFIKELWGCLTGTKDRKSDNKVGQQVEPSRSTKRQIFLLICSIKPIFSLIIGLLSCF